jgi:ribosomal protein L37E
MNEAGVCVEYKRQHPDRDCQVSVGIKIAYAACPIGQWGRRMIECPDCSRVLFEPDREPAACSYCGWPNKKRAATEATALPLAD